MRSGVTHYPMSCHGCFVGCGEMTPSRLQPMTRQTLHISRLWRDMILPRLRPYLLAAPATKIIRMALWRRRPGSIQVAPHVQAGGVGATWAPCARMAGEWLETKHIRPDGGPAFERYIQFSCYLHGWACELPATHELPLSRWSTSYLVREVRSSGLVASISGSTLWRWLHQDAIRLWYHRSWIFPRDPDFAEKAGRLLDLYARQWQSKPLKDDELLISADEKTSIQARVRKHPTRSCRPRRSMRVEHAYQRGGAWVYLSALDVHNARVFGRFETKNGIAPFDRLVEQVMTRPPYNDAIHAPIHTDRKSTRL